MGNSVTARCCPGGAWACRAAGLASSVLCGICLGAAGYWLSGGLRADDQCLMTGGYCSSALYFNWSVTHSLAGMSSRGPK